MSRKHTRSVVTSDWSRVQRSSCRVLALCGALRVTIVRFATQTIWLLKCRIRSTLDGVRCAFANVGNTGELEQQQRLLFLNHKRIVAINRKAYNETMQCSALQNVQRCHLRLRVAKCYGQQSQVANRNPIEMVCMKQQQRSERSLSCAD
jgi:hypothetical protein